MAIAEQNKYIQFVNLLNISNFFSDVSNCAVSPMLNSICVVSKQKDAFIYLLPKGENNTEPFWQCPSKVQRCFFSEDGKSILAVLNVNSFQIYSISEKKVSLVVQIKASLLANILEEYKIDFSAASRVEPVKLKLNELIVVVNKKFLFNIEWSLIKKPKIKYSLSVESSCDLFLNENYIFVLFNCGIIIYNVITGEKCCEDLNLQKANRKNPEFSVGYSFFKVSVNSSSNVMAVVNQDEETVLLDTNEYFKGEKRFCNFPVEFKKEKWTWPYKNRKPSTESKLVTYKILGKVSPPPGLVVSHLQFALKGLFAFYSILGQSRCINFKVIDETSGDVLYTFDGLVESKVITGGPLPLVMTDSILSICLGVLCNDYFIIKLCEVVPNFGFSKEIEKTLFSRSWGGAVQFHFVFLKIILSLHLNIFNSNLRLLRKKDNGSLKGTFSERKMMERIDELFKVVLDYKENENSENLNVKQSMLVDCFIHAVNLLDMIHVETKENLKSDFFSALLKHIMTLSENVRQSDPLRDEWITWLDKTDLEVIQEAVIIGAVALAHVFLITQRGWPIDEVEAKFKSEAHAWVEELTTMNEFERAKVVLNNLGCDAVEHLKSLCLDATDPLVRDALVSHLIEIEELNGEEIEAWNFNKKIEAALFSVIKKYHTFEQKMFVSARDRAKIIAYKGPPYTGCLNLRTILQASEEWKEMVLTEVFFNTGDITLEKTLKKERCWQFLLETNQVGLLTSWINIICDTNHLNSIQKPSSFLTRSFYNLFGGWMITEDMLSLVNEVKCMTTTKDCVLDNCAFHGLFSTAEKNCLRAIVYRLENNSLLSSVKHVLSKASSNTSLFKFDDMIFKKCIQHSLKPVIVTCLHESVLLKESLAFKAEYFWIEVWNLFSAWESNKTNQILLNDIIRKSLKISSLQPEEFPLIALSMALMENKEISDLIEKQGNQCTLLQLALVQSNWQTAQGTSNKSPDVSLYDLLKCSNIPVDKSFLWQSQNKNSTESYSQELFVDFPHFNHQVLGVKHGFKQNLDHIYYLKQGRPSFACNLFIVESLRNQRRLTTKMIKRVCGVAHGLALKHWRENSICCACVAFITMLGDIASSNILRIHLAAIECTFGYLSKVERNYISTLVRGIIYKELSYLEEMAALVESSVMVSVEDEKSVVQLEKWYLAVSFCNTHNLPLPTLLLKYLAYKHEWFTFVLCLDIFKYPYEQAIDLIEEIESKILKSHLIRALTRTTLKLSTTSPSKSPPKILLEPENNGKDDLETIGTKDNKDVFQSFVANVYTEVLNTIQTFTDKNIVLPWSCEQDPDFDVLLTLLKCESEPDPSKSLLISSIELQSPVLAVLATCFQSDIIFPNLIAWLVSSIPTSMSRSKRREEGQQLVDRLYGSKEVETLFVYFFSTGYFQTFHRGMSLFMTENPLTLFLNAIYYSIILLDFTTAFELLKEFMVEMTPFRIKEALPFISKQWILKMVAQCIENVLTRSDLQNSTKRQFLRIVAASDLASLDPIFPNYLLWFQICEILESSETNLEFIQLYDITMISEELQNCLDTLVDNCQFTQALEICSLLSLNKDKYIIAMWKHHLDLSVKTKETNRKVWADSSLAFKDENVSPNLAASFYYNMSSLYDSSSAESLKKRYFALEYCLHWRRLIEDTLSTSFKEESDSIELEKWKCCLEPNFDTSVLKIPGPVDLSYSLLVSIYSSSKVLIRCCPLDNLETERVKELINMFLDQGDLHKALRIGAFFKSNNEDLTTIISCLKMIDGELTPSELSKFNSTSSCAPKNLLPQDHSLNEVDLSEYDVVPSREQKQMLSLLNKLCQTVKHGRTLINKILVCYRLSVNLDTTFKDIASERDYLTLLSRSISLEGINKFNVASDLFTLADLPEPDLSKFLRDKIVSAIMESHSTGLVIPVTLWDISLESDFHLIINLLNNPSLLGFELLQASVNLPCNGGVEVLIRAHDCFTASCNVEGIGKVLRRARILASFALQEEEWQHLVNTSKTSGLAKSCPPFNPVRLLIGIKRYTDMRYIFQMLKDNGQFEQLLRKGMHKAPGLHVAISEFLHRHCPQDRELGKMVAAHFGLHAKLASLWLEEADEIILKLLANESTWLRDNSKTRNALNLAADNYSHAVQWFLQAGKLNKALKVSHQAQIVALQISLLGGPLILKIQSRTQLQNLVNESLSVWQSMLVSRAYGMEPDWILALHERWILKGDKSFYADLKSTGLLTLQLIRHHSIRYNSEQLTNSKAKERMKQLLITSDQHKSPLIRDLNKN